MAKRLIDTAIFRKDFIRSLDAPCKLLFMYLINECDHAGLWDVEFEVMEIRLGLKFKKSPLDQFGNKVVVVDGGKKWFIPSFVEFQYGELNENNRVHASVISILSKHDLLDENNQIKPLTSPSQGCKDMDKEKDIVVHKEKKEKEKSTKVDFSIVYNMVPAGWPAERFTTVFKEFWDMRIDKKKPLSENAVKRRINQLYDLSGGIYDQAEIICLRSTDARWDEFYPLDKSQITKTSQNGRIRDKF